MNTPIDYYVDFSFSQPPPSVIKAAGYGGACIYLDAALPDGAYIQALRDNGLEIVLIKEQGTTDAYGGFDVGVQFARSANTRADMIGAPKDATIAYVVADTPYTDANGQNGIRAFCDGVRSVGGRPAGFYGNMAALQGTPGWFWGVETWSNARDGLAGWDGFGAAMIQMANTRVHTIQGYSTDENNVYIENFGQWGASGAPQAQDPLDVSNFTVGAEMIKFTDANGTSCEFYRQGTKLVVRYWKQGAPGDPVLLSSSCDGQNMQMLPVAGFGVTLVHAVAASGKIIEAFPTAFGYQAHEI